jgi:hypothetical protein
VKRVPFYLTQDQRDGLAQSLYKLQHLVDVASDSPLPKTSLFSFCQICAGSVAIARVLKIRSRSFLSPLTLINLNQGRTPLPSPRRGANDRLHSEVNPSL